MLRVRHFAWLGSLAFATSALAQQTADERLAGRLGGDTRDQVVALVDSLKREGLPTEPIIVRVVRSFASHLRVARQVLGAGTSDREIIAGANALKAGIKTEELVRIRAAREGQRYAVAFDVLTGLKNRNVPNDTAVRVIGSLVKLAATDQQYVTLLDQVERAIAAGTQPALAASEQGVTIERAVVAGAANSGALGAPLPSARGALRDPSASGTATGAAAGIQPEGQGAPAPRGKSQRPRKP